MRFTEPLAGGVGGGAVRGGIHGASDWARW